VILRTRLISELSIFLRALAFFQQLKTVSFSKSIETLINEEALLLANYLKGENDSWIQRVPSFPFSTVVEWQIPTHE